MTSTWHLITGEYPPQPGGVGDYTRLVACGLAEAGQDVHVWAPPAVGADPADSNVSVHRLTGHFDLRSLRMLGASLNAWPRPSRLLVQYVPHAFGWKAMNVAFCRWLLRRRQAVWVMLHEVAFPWEPGQSWKHQLLGGVTTAMARWVARSAERIFVSIPGWRDRLRRFASVNDRTDWLPVPSNLPTSVDPGLVRERRAFYGVPDRSPLLGHLGTYGELIADPLAPALRSFLARGPNRHCLLMGRGSDRFAQTLGDSSGQIHATGELPARQLSECLSACDVLLQPYPDGISCRRGSAMAGLALGRPLVSTFGRLSEPLWPASRAVCLAPAVQPDALSPLVEELFADEAQRRELGERARRLYVENFALARTIDVLLGRVPPLPFPADNP